MRLLDTTSLEFGEFFRVDQIDGPYWILSHRWEDQETTLQQWPGERELSLSQCRRGTAKIKNFCKLAASAGIKWAWVDTCCIDKTSSAELTESINSMYSWYGHASRCIVYLNDVQKSVMENDRDHFKKTVWFTRGFTLQELLAPKEHHFYDSNWLFVGSRHSLADEIADVTGIELMYFGGHSRIQQASVAQRMSWVSKRETTRPEDLAYCMLGIFDVNMPLIYGEGHQAFHRLQIAIMQRSPDETIFAWRAPLTISGLLADHPLAFADTQKLGIVRSNKLLRPPSSVTSRGVHFHVTRTLEDRHHGKHYWTTLDCKFAGTGAYVGICLVNIQGEWFRTHCYHLHRMSEPEHSHEESVNHRFNQMQERLAKQIAKKSNSVVRARKYINPIYVNQYEIPAENLALKQMAPCLNSHKDRDVHLWDNMWSMDMDDTCFGKRWDASD